MGVYLNHVLNPRASNSEPVCDVNPYNLHPARALTKKDIYVELITAGYCENDGGLYENGIYVCIQYIRTVILCVLSPTCRQTRPRQHHHKLQGQTPAVLGDS